MKALILALLVSGPFTVMAYEGGVEVQQNTGRYNCFYQDGAMGYKYGAIAKTLEVAKARAQRECYEFLNRSDLEVYGCTFVGCRQY